MQGLQVGATVTYRGVTIGRVTALGLVSAEYGTGETIDVERQTYRQVFVRYVVDTAKIGRVPDTKTSVELGLRARLASQGITGLSYLELDFVNPAQYPALVVPWTPKGQYIPSMPSAFTQVRDAAQEFLAKLNRVDIDALSAHLNGLHKRCSCRDVERRSAQYSGPGDGGAAYYQRGYRRLRICRA